jgi:5'-phosphate synthase pdxT subunit
VVRNGYGRQLHSGSVPLASDVLPAGTSGTFIRAPRITAVGAGVDVLARRGADPVLVQKGPLLAACFHPELAGEHPVVARFAGMVRASRGAEVAR